MTPQLIRARLLSARLDAVRYIAEDIRLQTPHLHNVAELVQVLDAERRSIQREILDLQREREESHSLSGATSGGSFPAL